MTINGINPAKFQEGWWGEKGEGVKTLRSLALPVLNIPFDVNMFLRFGKLEIPRIGAKITMETNNEYYLLTYGVRSKDSKHIKLFREWPGEDDTYVTNIESFALGECVRKLLNRENLI